jgi:hypothetical protein
MVQAAYALAEKNASSYNSMVQGFFKGKKTEIDFISGAIVKEGKKLGVDTPFNEAMTFLVKALETYSYQFKKVVLFTPIYSFISSHSYPFLAHSSGLKDQTVQFSSRSEFSLTNPLK